MARHPIESNFYASVSDAEIEVTFAPTSGCNTPRDGNSEGAEPVEKSCSVTMQEWHPYRQIFVTEGIWRQLEFAF
jgi:hypothetical protein